MLSLILAGITSLPFFGWTIACLPIFVLAAVLPLLFLTYKSTPSPKNKSCNVIITGGSSGIGLAIAKECCLMENVKRITLIARNKNKLSKAKEELLKQETLVDIQIVSANVTDYNAIQKVSQTIEMQDCTYLFCCAGVSHPGYFTEIPPQVFEDQIKLNYLGTVYTVKAILPRIKSGCITLTSSGAGQVGVFGFTAYSPTKFALRGFAEALHMELSSTPINIQVAFPNDTNTPGYQKEQTLKPKECQLISESGGLWEPSDIAKKMCKEAMRMKNPPFFVYFGLEGWMLTTLTGGMSPVSGVLEGVMQVTLMGLFRFISLFYLQNFWNIVRQCANEKSSSSALSSTTEDKKEQ